LLEIDPIELVRGARQPEDYVNDRPYVAASHMTVALRSVFGTALAGNCNRRPELVRKTRLEIVIEVVRVRGGSAMLHRLFEPLGDRVSATEWPLDEAFALSQIVLARVTTVFQADDVIYLMRRPRIAFVQEAIFAAVPRPSRHKIAQGSINASPQFAIAGEPALSP